MPWRWVTGNHDILNQGNFPTTAEVKATHLGTLAQFGARDWSQPLGLVVQNMTVVADPRREPFTRANLLEELAATADGHGLSEAGARAAPLAAEFRRRSAVDFTSGWGDDPGSDPGVMEFWFPR